MGVQFYFLFNLRLLEEHFLSFLSGYLFFFLLSFYLCPFFIPPWTENATYLEELTESLKNSELLELPHNYLKMRHVLS